jgi:hypothetical protein
MTEEQALQKFAFDLIFPRGHSPATSQKAESGETTSGFANHDTIPMTLLTLDSRSIPRLTRGYWHDNLEKVLHFGPLPRSCG